MPLFVLLQNIQLMNHAESRKSFLFLRCITGEQPISRSW